MPTPQAKTEIAGYNRIADAIEALTEAINANNAALIAALGGGGQPQIIYVNPTPITISPAAPMITVSPAEPQITVQSAVPAITVQASEVVVQPNITVQGGDSGHGGGCGCSDGLLCAIAPGMAALTQMNKAIQYLAKDSPYPTDQLGQFPDPRDVDPPQIYFPGAPTSATTPPPIGFIAPPGGMAGGHDISQYDAYKCDMAHYIVEYLISYYEAIAEFFHEASDMLNYFSMLKDAQQLYAAVSAKMAAKEIVYNVVAAGTEMGAKTLAKDAVGLSFIEVAVLIEGLIKLSSILSDLLGNAFDEHVAYLKTRRKALVCGLLKGEKAYDSINALNKAAEKFWKPTFNMGQGYAWARINATIIGSLADNLFACKEGYDFSSITGFGNEMGGCDGCNFDCSGATLTMDFANGKQGWRAVWPNNTPPSPDNSFGEALGNGTVGNTDQTPTGLIGFKNARNITIESGTVRTFSQICVSFGGEGGAYNDLVVYVNDVVAFQTIAKLEKLSAEGESPVRYANFGTVSFNIEDNLSPAFLESQTLVNENSQIRGTIKVTRRADHQIGSGAGEARIFGVAIK